MYEPVQVLFEYINTSDKNDTTGSEFLDLLDFIKFRIKTGHIIYDKPNAGLYALWVNNPKYIIPAKDTLFISMILNFTYGEKFTG